MEKSKLKPISLPSTISVFSFSCVIIIFGVYVVIPKLIEMGIPFLIGYLVAFQTVPFMILFLQMMYLYQREGNVIQLHAVIERLRLTFHWNVLLIGCGVFVFGVLTYLPLQSVTNVLANTSFFHPPDWFPPDLHPMKSSIQGEFMGFPMQGMFWIPVVYLIGWFFNILGEELLFRGYLLPRQELRYGTYAWIVNGLCWNIWHVFWWWQMLALLPFHLLLTFTVQKTKCTWVGIVGHGLLNFIVIVLLLKLSFSTR